MPLVNSKIDLSIIIVSYKSKDHLAVLLPSIFQSTKKYSFEVIIVDNDSRDGTAEAVSGLLPTIPNLKLIRNQNSGFSAGNNLGIKNSSGKYILLLNPDTKVQPDTFEVMLDMMENRPEVGISGCKLIMGDGKLDLACRRRFPNPANSFKRLFLLNRTDYNYTDIDDNREMEVDSVVGAFLLIRRSVADKIGPLDENYFMYGEDLDWCWSCKAAGAKVLYYPRTFIYHYKRQSSQKAPLKTLKAFHNSMWIFYKKHYAASHSALFNWFVWCGIYGRFGILAAINYFKTGQQSPAS